MNFLDKIFSPLILTISFLLLIYTFYRSEIILGGINRIYYLNYYFISSLLIIFSILSFFINKKIKEYLIIIGITLVCSLYLFEGYAVFKKKFSKEKLFKNQTEKKWDQRSRYEIYKDLKNIENEITVSLTPHLNLKKNYSTFPFSGVSNKRTINCNENGYYSIYQSDRYGFNNPDTEWDKKKIEYLLVGDSFTHGACVNRPNDIGSVIRTLSNKSVLNLGQGGNGPLIEFATLREYLDINVKKILWIYFEGNDLIDLESELNNQILTNYLNNLSFTQNLKLRQNEINNILVKILNKADYGCLKDKFINFICLSNIRKLIFYPRVQAQTAPKMEFKKILQLTKDLIKKNNSKLYFVYLPEKIRYETNYDNIIYNSVKNIVTELDITFIDIHEEVFEKSQNPLELFSGHYNVEGYKKVAETIYKFTQD